MRSSHCFLAYALKPKSSIRERGTIRGTCVWSWSDMPGSIDTVLTRESLLVKTGQGCYIAELALKPFVISYIQVYSSTGRALTNINADEISC